MESELSNVFIAFVMQVLSAVLPVLAALVAGYLLVLIRRAEVYIRTRLSAEQLAQADAVITMLVLAAEQSGLKDTLLSTGEAKKQWVLGEAQRILNENGLGNINVDTLASLVEKAVHEKLNYGLLAIESYPLGSLEPVE